MSQEDVVKKRGLSLFKIGSSESSQLTEVHEQIKNAPSVLTVNWKNLLTKTDLPNLPSETEPLQHQIQWSLDRLRGQPVVVSFYIKRDDLHLLEKMNNYIHARSDFWVSLLKETTHLHVRAHKGKLLIWLKTEGSAERHAKFVQATFEREYLSHSHQLKSFQVKCTDGWSEILFDVDARNLEIQYKGSDL